MNSAQRGNKRSVLAAPTPKNDTPKNDTPRNDKVAVALADGAVVESVLYRGDTLCISSQVGCGVRCPFCASGANGVARNLSVDEMKSQVLDAEARGAALRRVTVSGVGEPLHNGPEVEALIAWCHARRTPASLTTSGGPLSRLTHFLEDVPHNGITVSVHAGTEAARARLVPHGPALAPLFSTIARALPSLTRTRRKRTALAYLLLAGENDGDAEVEAFIERELPLSLQIHLYDYNTVPTSAMQGAGRPRYEAVYARMVASGLKVRMSSQARLEANGGCGTLVALRPSA